jgi:hypothetical protein
MKTTQQVLTAAFLMIFFVTIGVIIGYNMKTYEVQNSTPARIIDRETISTASRPATKVYVRTEHRYFYPGDTLSSKENGALINWESWMGEDMIVGVVSDSGTIEEVK